MTQRPDVVSRTEIRDGELSDFAKSFHYGTRGTGCMTHADPDSRPPSIFDNHVTLHAGGNHPAWLMLPVI